MNKYFKKFGIMFVMALILSLGFCISAFADDGGVVGTSNLNGTAQNSAVKGNQLTAPEIGWKRYDDTDSRIKYGGGTWSSLSNASVYKGVDTFSDAQGATISFKFYGTKLRIIDSSWSNRSANIVINIDGTEYDFSEFGENQYQAIVFEKLNLNLGIHEVIITNRTLRLGLDAIDIDDAGSLINPNESISLDKSSMNLNEGDSGELTATTTPEAVGVTWIVSDPSIATIEVDPTNGKITKVTALKEGTCTITATTADGNNLSASCIINVSKKDDTEPSNPTDPTDKTGAILIINLTDGETKVFDVSASEAAKFKEWYNTKTEYENQITYEFDKTVNSSISIEEDVVHDQVTSYEIRKY